MEWRRLDPVHRFGLRLALAGAAIVLVAVPFGLLLASVTRTGWLTEIDTLAANHLHAAVRRSPGLVSALKGVTFLGSPFWFYPLCGGLSLVLWRRNQGRLAAYLAGTTLGGGAVNTAVKLLVDRDRPSLADPVASAHGASFPSGHVMVATVAYGALLLVFLPSVPRRRRTAVVAGAVTLVLAIGFSRLALGVHYISDVLGGFVLGLAWLAGATAAFQAWRLERGRRPVARVTDGLEPEAAEHLAP